MLQALYIVYSFNKLHHIMNRLKHPQAFLNYLILFLLLVASSTYSNNERLNNLSLIWKSDSLQIEGVNIVPCLPEKKVYTLSKSFTDQQVKVWQWYVMGGVFENGKTEWIDTGINPKPVTVNWHYSNSGGGLLSLKIVALKENGDKGQNLGTTSIVVRLGPPKYIEIIREEGTYSCRGNWYLLKNLSLATDEIVEWRVKNGTDTNGKIITSIKNKGGEKPRLFIKPFDPNLPIEISVLIESLCINGISTTTLKVKKFPSFLPNLKALSTVELKKDYEFVLCRNPDDSPYYWETTGDIIKEDYNSARIQFNEPGENYVSFNYQNCQGQSREIIQMVTVAQTQGDYVKMSSVDRNNLSFRVYPNPIHSGQLQIELIKKTEDPIVMAVANVEGVTLKKMTIIDNSTTIDITHFPPGIYILQFITSREILTEKVSINLH
jgi:Secretion system C-terminal sorting domain